MRFSALDSKGTIIWDLLAQQCGVVLCLQYLVKSPHGESELHVEIGPCNPQNDQVQKQWGRKEKGRFVLAGYDKAGHQHKEQPENQVCSGTRKKTQLHEDEATGMRGLKPSADDRQKVVGPGNLQRNSEPVRLDGAHKGDLPCGNTILCERLLCCGASEAIVYFRQLKDSDNSPG
jgi:hypothetical protein